MNILLYTSLGIFTAYVIVTNILHVKKYSYLLPSLSESYYFYEDLHKGLGVMFEILLMFIVPMGLIPNLMEHTPEGCGIIPVLAVFGVMLVGAAPLFKSHQVTIHSVGAIGAAIVGFIWSIITNTWMFWIGVTFLVAVIYGFTFKISKYAWLFWLEMIAFYSIYLSIILIDYGN